MLRLTLTPTFVARSFLCLLLWVSATHAQSAALITAESLQDWALREATQQYGSLEGARIEVQVGALDARLTQAPFPQPQYTVPSGARLWGHSAVMVRCPGNAAWSLRAPVQVRVWGTALVAARALPALLPISENDLRPGEVELIAGLESAATDSTGRAAGNAEVFAIRGVALAYLLELACIEGQSINFQRVEMPTLKGLWQQARIVCLNGWQLGLQRAQFQHAVGGT